MPYTPTTWVNGSAPALSATNLNNIETGISNSINKDGSVAMTAQFVTVAGSSTTPSIAPTGDTNTGIFFPSADTMAFVEGGAEVMRITSSGTIGINTNTTNTNLHVKGTGSTTWGGTPQFGVQSTDANNTRLWLSATSTASYIGGGGSTTNPPIIFTNDGSTEYLRINTNGQVQTITGTQTTPSIAISTDTNTGIYWASADKLAITEGGKGLTFDEFKMSLCMGAMI